MVRVISRLLSHEVITTTPAFGVKSLPFSIPSSSTNVEHLVKPDEIIPITDLSDLVCPGCISSYRGAVASIFA